MFRRGLAQALERTNAILLDSDVQIRRFQVLREEFTVDNGLLFPDRTLNRVAITIRYRHLIDDMFQHEASYPSKWMPELQPAPQGTSPIELYSHLAERSQTAVRGHADAASASEHQDLSSDPPTRHNPHASQFREERYTGYCKEPSPRAFTREASPRQYTQASPRQYKQASPRQYTPRKGQRLPQSVRMLDMDTGSLSLKTPTPRERGRSK